MKRVVLLLLAAMVCLSACGKAGQEGNNTENTTKPQELVDVALEDRYLAAISHLKQYLAEEQILLLDEQTQEFYRYKGNDALTFLQGAFAALGDYKQAKEIADRFSTDGSFVGMSEGIAVDKNGQESQVQGICRQVDPQGRCIAVENTRYIYNENGLLTEENVIEGGKVSSSVVYTYNESKQLVSEKHTLSDESSYEISYTYNEFGKIRTKTGNGEDTTYSYTYDDQGHLLTASSISEGNGQYEYAYDGAGNMISQKLVGEQVAELHRTYDENNHMVAEEILNGEEIIRKTYVYEGARLIQQTETTLKNDKLIKQVTWNFTYKPKVDFNREGLTLTE